MASTTDAAFPEANATRDLNHSVPEEFPVDPISSDVAATREQNMKDQNEEVKARTKAKLEAAAAAQCGGSTLMSALVVTGVVVAAVGVAFFVTKKLRTNT